MTLLFQKHDFVTLIGSDKKGPVMLVERIGIKDISAQEETTYAFCTWVETGVLQSREFHYSLLCKNDTFNDYYGHHIKTAKALNQAT